MVLVSIQRIGHADFLPNLELMAILFSVLRLLYCALSIVSPVESESYGCLSGLSLSSVPQRLLQLLLVQGFPYLLTTVNFLT